MDDSRFFGGIVGSLFGAVDLLNQFTFWLPVHFRTIFDVHHEILDGPVDGVPLFVGECGVEDAFDRAWQGRLSLEVSFSGWNVDLLGEGGGLWRIRRIPPR